ncbi:MAG TPA: ABC transporter ATP-binding protein [Candidatus Saccharimonadales bacterium]|nr:ABC transporter ATP-binding protein [Candidatus Saccharimonadales bacterium]
MATAGELIQLSNVTRTYHLGDETLNALDGVTLRIRSGEFVAITGPSGSGKSTLANIIGGLDRPTSGSVVVDGNDLSHVRDGKLSTYRNQHMGFVFQSFNLQGMQTALENVMLPLLFARMKPKARKARAAECLRAVGLGDRLNHRPGQLSGGQRQRVAIARALAVKPQIIIADEPTGNLDSKRGEEIIRLLKSLNKDGITLIVITHDPTVARQASRILEIHDGKLTERRG